MNPARPRLLLETRALALVSFVATLPASVGAQVASPPSVDWLGAWLAPLARLGGPVEDRARIAQLLDSTRSTAGFLLRSPSSLTPPLGGGGSRTLRLAIVPPSIAAVYNSALPYSGNDGALWAGRGMNVLAQAGVRAEWGPLRLIVAPELAYASNRDYAAFDVVVRPSGAVSVYANPWHTAPNPNSIDLPLRFGNRKMQRGDPGQSSLVLRIGSAEVGVATENEWWGPGIRNALILSNNAPGFPHVLLRSAAPIQTRVGAFEARWLVGGLTESEFFDTNTDDNLRSISLLAFTWQPRWERDLTVGAARAVFAPASSWSSALGDFAQVFANVPGHEGVQNPGRDQLMSLFLRWVFPADGFEAYAEWARAEQPVSFRDLLLSPNHSQAYTLGLQWVGREVAPWGRARGRVRVQGEVSFLEQSTTYRYRPIGTWYTSPRVIQGYTNRGQTLGAAIGPGSSSQYLRADYLSSWWQLGAFAERIRSLEDAHSTVDQQSSFCNHDVSLLPGLAAAVRTRVGTFGATYSSGWRINTYFIVRPGTACLNFDGMDVRSNSLSVSFTPLSW
jgi:capsule assembly protein Wzi